MGVCLLVVPAQVPEEASELRVQERRKSSYLDLDLSFQGKQRDALLCQSTLSLLRRWWGCSRL